MKLKNSIRALFFDMDETLVRIVPKKAITQYFNFIKSLKDNINDSEIKKAYEKAYRKWKELAPELIGRRKYITLWELCLEELRINGNKYELASKLQTQIESYCDVLYPDVTKTLKILYEKGFFLGILSDRIGISIRKSLERHGILKFFNAYISAFETDSTEGKLNPNVWKKLTIVTGQPRNRILYVGDNYKTDIQPALENDINAVLVNRDGKYNYAQVKCPVITRLEELVDMLLST